MESTAKTPEVRDARAEAQAKLGSAAGSESGSEFGSGFTARVLEPSPPAVTVGPFFADDPVDGSDAAGDRLVLPAGLGGATDWSSIVQQVPELADWAAANWLGGARRLPALPADLITTRLALHRLGVYVIAPKRHAANEKFGLRFTAGGFGTPFFADPVSGEDTQIRVEGTDLIHQQGDAVRVSPITTLAAAAEFLDSPVDTETAAEHDSPDVGDLDETLPICETASQFLGHWFGMGFAALESVRADDRSVDPSRPQLWPGHFDPAIEVGDEDHRASYGASPGDDSIDEPYLYVSIWYPDRIGMDAADPAWNAPSFTGSILKLSDFPSDTDPVTVAADFWKTTRDRIG